MIEWEVEFWTNETSFMKIGSQARLYFSDVGLKIYPFDIWLGNSFICESEINFWFEVHID
jgi:hypothetical protein